MNVPVAFGPVSKAMDRFSSVALLGWCIASIVGLLSWVLL